MSGEVLRLGGKHLDAEGYDLLGLITGSEGLLGVVTEVTVRILQKAETAARRADRLSDFRGRRRLRVRDHRRRHHSRRHGDDGPARDPRRRGIRPCRLSARCRGAADRRTRRPRGGSRSSDRARRENRQANAMRRPCRVSDFGRRAAAVLGRAQGGVPGGRAHLAGLLLHGRHHPARAAAGSAGGDEAKCRRITACASPMCFTPATAICIR